MPAIPQLSFVSGEISPLLHGRIETPQYGTACRTLRNMILTPQGPALNRPGTQYICEVKDSTQMTRLIPFQFSSTAAYILEFGDQYIRIHDISTGTVLAEIVSPYLEAHLFQLKYIQSADIMWITHPSYMPRILYRVTAGSWYLDKFYTKGGPWGPINTTATTITLTGASVLPGQPVDLTASADIFAAGHVESLFGIRHMHGQASYSVTCPETGAWTSASYQVFGPWTITVTPDRTKKLDEAAVYLERSLDNGQTWLVIYTWSPTPDYTPIVTIGAEWDEPALLRFKRTVSPTVGDLATFNLESQGGLRWAAVRITTVTDARHASGTLLDPFDRAGVALATWAEGAWSDIYGWPICCTFYEDRLVFEGSPKYPDTWWASQPGDYNNFGEHIPPVESDMVSFTLLSRTVNSIRSTIPIGDVLIMFTAGGEWAVSGAQSPLSPLSIMAHQHGHAGSAAADPVGIGTVAIHPQALGGALRELYYDEAAQGYDGNNISVMANHLTDGQVVREMAYQQVPWSVVWIVLESGALLGLTYMRNQQVVAWHRHDSGAAGTLFESVATIPGATENEVWFVVKRFVNGAWRRYIERLEARVDNVLADAFFVDCGITYSGAPATVIGGLAHLEGETVAVLADGVPVAGKVVSGGQITLDAPASKVHVGLPIQADFESLGAEYNAGDGTSMGKRKRISSVTPRLYRSAGGQIGKDADHLHDIQYLAAGMSGGLFTGSLEPQPIEADWTREGRVYIRQDDPLPMTITAVIPEVEHGG